MSRGCHHVNIRTFDINTVVTMEIQRIESKKTEPETTMFSDIEVAPVAEVPYSIFTRNQKVLILVIVSFAVSFTAFAGDCYFPAIPSIARDLGVSDEDINVSVTVYMVFQGLAPSVWGVLSDIYGRRIAYILTFLVFIVSCIGLGETKSYYQLVILRCIQAAGSSSTVALGVGVLGDITTQDERGGYVGYFQGGLSVAKALGPILGGIIADKLGWRAIFWFLTIYGAVFIVLLGIFLPETLRSLVGNGSLPAHGWAASPYEIIQRRWAKSVHTNDLPKASNAHLPVQNPQVRSKLNILSSIRILFRIEVIFIVAFLSLYYTVWTVTMTSMSVLFTQRYSLNLIQIGLTFIGNGVGCVLGTVSTGHALNSTWRRLESNYKGDKREFPIESARLQMLWLWGAMQCIATIAFGWTLYSDIHICLPIICTFFLGWAATSIQSIITTYLVDLNPRCGASATAALNLARCWMGAAGTAAILPLVKAIDVGWTFTLCTGILVAATGLLFIQMRFGPRWRRRREQAEEAQMEQIELNRTSEI